MTIDAEFGSPLPPIEIACDAYHLRPFLADRAVGQIGLWISHLHKGRVEIGYWIVASGRGQGAASHAVKAFSDWAFEHLDADRLSLFIEPWNTASIKTADRAGYEREGLLRSWERIGGVPRDMWSFARTRPDDAG